MPPSCTPEKKNEYQNEQAPPSVSNELYFTTKEYNVLRTSDIYEKENENGSNEIEKISKIFPDLDKVFNLHKQIGHGTFSTVYLASVKTDMKKRFAIKHIVPTCHPDRIKFELQCLKDIGGVDNVAGINLSLRNRNDVVLIMPYQPHDFFNDYVGEMDVAETACYMRNLLQAIARVHTFSIVHRDIKPSNFLYDRKNKRFMLVDFGLAHSIRNETTEKKRKRDMLSPTSNDVTQPLKKIATTSRTAISILGASQKENDPTNNKQKDCKRSCASANFQQHQSNRNRKRAPITLTKSPPIPFKSQNNENSCRCYGKAKTCNMCITKKTLKALRAGTPGFRPPEVLLKSDEQNTAIDIWAAGIIMLSILSNCCNFFSSPDDMTALAEIMIVFGSEEVKKVANQLGRYLLCSEISPALDLRKICCSLRARDKLSSDNTICKKCCLCKQPEVYCLCIGTPLNNLVDDKFTDDAYDLLSKLLDINVRTRIRAADALNHPFLRSAN